MSLPYFTGHPDIGARVTHSVAQSILNAVVTTLAFDTERWDTDGIHDPVTNNSRLTCRTPGRYLIVGNIRWPATATGERILILRLNGTVELARSSQAGSTATNPHLIAAAVYPLVVGDYLECTVWQTSGGAQDVEKIDQYSPEFMMQLLALG